MDRETLLRTETTSRDEALALVSIFEELYAIPEGVVDSVHINKYTKSGSQTDELFPEAIGLNLKPIYRQFDIALADPSALPYAEARLGGVNGIEIPSLSTFLSNIARLDTEVIRQSKQLNNQKVEHAYGWSILSYGVTEKRLLFLYDARMSVGGHKHGIAPFLYDLPANQVLNGDVTNAELQPTRMKTDGYFGPDQSARITYSDKTLLMLIQEVYRSAHIESFRIVDGQNLPWPINERTLGVPTQEVTMSGNPNNRNWQSMYQSGGCTSPVTHHW